MFAIVDIETTGGHAADNGITEIAIVLHNGKTVEGKFSTLINPRIPIQKYVQSLTGITDKMVAGAPLFSEMAANIFNLLHNRVFVAHNVNFDYSFVKHQLAQVGYELKTPKLCTIRLARKIFPGLQKYGLANVCKELNISIVNHHRATGDALATAELFALLVQNDSSGELQKMMLRKNGEQYLPPNVTAEQLQVLPADAGVYYFHNEKGKVVYVGKAKNIKKRVVSHFSNNKPSKQKQDFLRNIYQITYKVCGSELMAALLESIEIKRLWPEYNKSQKHAEQQYGFYMFEDAKGYMRLVIDKRRKYLKPLYSFNLYADAHRVLWKLVKEFNIHPALCFLDKRHKLVTDLPEVKAHNVAVQLALEALRADQKSYIIKDGATNYILVEEGRFYGMGTIEQEIENISVHIIKPLLTQYPENETLRSMLHSYIERYPQKTILI
jgi:DNA polymerase-3 subunit epsilon